MLNAVQVTNLSKQFNTVSVLRDLSFTIPAGKMSAIVGRSGSGKSTLLSLLSGLDSPSSGTVSIDGVELSGLSESELAKVRRERIGIVFQGFHLIPSLDALANVLLPVAFEDKTMQAEQLDLAKRLLDEVELGHRLNHRPAQLSGGEQQRVAIARSLIQRPQVLLADEPTGNLDESTGKTVLSLLRKISREYGTTLVVVTHDAQIAQQAEQRLQLSNGEISDETN